MSHYVGPDGLICTTCEVYRKTRYGKPPERAKVLGPGEIHCAATCQVYANLAAYRQALGTPKGSVERAA